MNMKKTIAALAAGAVAVSAMATSVSALQDQTLTYNLVRTKETTNAGKVTLQITIQHADPSLEGLVFDFTRVDSKGNTIRNIDVKDVTIRVIDDNQAEQNRTYSYSTNKGGLNYNKNLGNGGFVFDKELDFLRNLTGSGTIVLTINGETNNYAQNEINSDIVNSDISIKPAMWATWATNDNKTTPDFWALDPDNGVSINTQVTPITQTAYTAPSKSYDKLPFVTGPSGNQNIAYYLQNNNVRSDTSSYSNVLPVLNDAIANYETVTFTFHTATKPIAWRDTINGAWGEAWGPSKSSWGDDNGAIVGTRGVTTENDDFSYMNGRMIDGYNTALAFANGNPDNVEAIYAEDWYGDSSYMSFAEHLYNGEANIYGPQQGWGGMGEGYVGFDWAGQNLFGGALVINENLTMSLSDIDYFDWTATTLSFDWDAIMDGAATSNQYATYIQSIKLATSVTWYWDSMDVVLVAGGETESADVAASTESEDETLDETPTEDEELTEDEPVEDEPVEDEPVEDEPVEDEPVEDEPAPVEDEPAPEPAPEVAPNPTTGNAPVALAVIPVALAAAAVVAKKRG